MIDSSKLDLNQSGLQRCEEMIRNAARLRVDVTYSKQGTRLIDCGIKTLGGLDAGRALAEICLANLGRVDLTPGDADLWPGPAVSVTTDQPLAACMASQYAGWQISGDKYFAMGSGPMRTANDGEELLDKIGFRQQPQQIVGVLESGELPTDPVCEKIAKACNVEQKETTLLVARTSSLAGTVQIVARSVETALHKMHELGFDISRVTSGFGVAPLPPVAADDLTAIGRTNDAVLYGAQTTLWLTGDDASLEQIGPNIPSESSSDFGRPFAEIFERYDRDFYKIDPLLFSPAQITLINGETGRTFRFGETRPEILRRSFLA